MTNPNDTRHAITIDRAPKGTPASRSYNVRVNGEVVDHASARSVALDKAALCRRALESVGLDVTWTIDNG